MSNESKKLSKDPWFSEINPNIFFLAMGLMFIAAMAGLLLVIQFPSALRVFKADEGTDFPVLLITAITLIAAAITVWISWLIKNEARDIGDNIVTNNVIHRHLDRIFHEYSMLIYSAYKQAKEEEIFVHLVSFDTALWIKSQKFLGKKEMTTFLKMIMPGDKGEDYKDMMDFERLIKSFTEITGSREEFEIMLQKILSQDQTQDQKEKKEKMNKDLTNIGATTYKLMKALGWKLDYSDFEIEYPLERKFVPEGYLKKVSAP